MYRLLVPIVVFLLLGSIARSSELRTWTDDTGNHKVEAKFSGTEDGKIKLTKKNGKVVKVDPEKLSDADQEYLGKQLEAWKAKKAAHTSWAIKMPTMKTGLATHDVVDPRGPQFNDFSQTPYAYKSYAYQPLQAMLVSYKGNNVVLRNNGGQATFKYNNFIADDQKFLDEYRLMENEAGSLEDIDFPKPYTPGPDPNSYTPGTSLTGQYDFGNGQTVSFDSNGTVQSDGDSGTWVYDGGWYHIHWHKGKHPDVHVKKTSKGNLHVKDGTGRARTAHTVAPPKVAPPSFHRR